MKKRLTLFVSGKVHRTGYRDRVIDIGKLLNLEGYAENLPDGRVRITAEGEEGNLNKFLDAVDIKNVLINVKHIDHSFSNATGEFYGFKKVVGEGETDERLDIAVDLMKQLIGAVREGFGETISAVKSVKEDTSAMVEKQDMMLEKQVITIDILKSVKEDIGEMKSHTSHIPRMKEDTATIRTDTKIIAAKLWEKYEELSKEIAQMKINLSKIEAKVFS
jgi:acylphosphatase